jgi:hypothetical protein
VDYASLTKPCSIWVTRAGSTSTAPLPAHATALADRVLHSLVVGSLRRAARAALGLALLGLSAERLLDLDDVGLPDRACSAS